MAEIDPVILELRADLLKYQSEMRAAASNAERHLGRQEKSVQRLEKQMLKSSTAIQGSLRGLAGALGTYFSGRELVGLIDGFTRLQNSLKVAGIEGADLARTQTELLALSTRYGVSIESLADLFGKAAQSGKDLGASQAQILQLTEATSQALLITGTSSQQASGAILGLTQALASGTVRAEEFNQINEGGLRPLLQAAAASEKYGGSVAKLRNAVIDGKVSSQEFYQAILAGSAQLEGQASKATLTLSGAFTALTSALTVYIGQSAEASGVTEVLAGAMQLLAENLDIIIPALAIIGTALAGRFVAGAILGSKALQSLAAYASIATTSLAGTSLAASGAGTALLKAFGGPVGLAITGVTLAIGALAYATRDTAASLADLEASAQGAKDRLEDARQQAKRAGVDVDALKKSADSAKNSFNLLGTALGMAANKMADITANARSAALATIALENAIARKAVNELGPSVRTRSDIVDTFRRRTGGTAEQAISQAGVDNLEIDRARLTVAKQTLEANKQAEAIIKALPPGVYKAPGAGGGSPASSADSKKPKKTGGSGPSGPSAADIEQRFNAELASVAQQTLSARQSLATSAEERAELELRSVELARLSALESLQADKDYSAAQKERVKDAIENLAEIERARIEREKIFAVEEEKAALADAEFRAQSDALRQQYDLAKTQAKRRDLAYEIIDLEYRHQEAALKAVIAAEEIAGIETERSKLAKLQLAALQQSKGATKEAARRDTAGPLESYFDKAKSDAENINELYEGIAVDGLRSLNDGLADAIVNSKSLGDVFKNVAKQIIADLIRIAIQQVIVNTLMSAFGGGSGGGGGFSSLFGRASGGYVGPGQPVRVNEHRGGFEGFRPTGSGTIIPVGQMNALAARPQSNGAGTVRLVIEEHPGFASRVEAISEGVAIEVTKIAAPQIADAGANLALARASRPTI